MTRINTNVSSLIAQKTLARSNADLQTSLTRLSTGLRINVGKDDPAGLIASEALRSDIISVEKGIANSERANQLIGTADSALGQVSQLLNDIRGLVSEAANAGALSEDQIAANQLQIDSSLEAIDRIAQITEFQGKRLLDGSLDFITTGVSSDIQGLQIDQANFGTQKSIGVNVNLVSQATRAQLSYAFSSTSSDTVLEIGGSRGTEAFNFAAGSTIDEIAAAVNLVSDATGVQAGVDQAATAGAATISSFGKNNDIVLTANANGFSEGNVRIKYTEGTSAGTTATFVSGTGNDPATLEVALQTQASVAASGKVNDQIAPDTYQLAAPVTLSAGATVQLTDNSGKSNTTVIIASADLGAAADAGVAFSSSADGDTITITRNTNGAAGDNTIGTALTVLDGLAGTGRFTEEYGGTATAATAITVTADTAGTALGALVDAKSAQSVVNGSAHSLTVTDATGANDTKIEVVGADLGAGVDASVALGSDPSGDVITITYNTNASAGDNTFGAAQTAIEALDGGSRFTTAIGGGGTTASLFDQADAEAAFTGGTESSNNAIDITARFSGSDFNGTSVNFVNDSLRVEAASAVIAGSETLEFSADAKASQALLDFAEGDKDFILTANTAGVNANEINIVTADAGAGNAPTATYDANTKTYTVSIDYADATVGTADIISAIANESTGLFTATLATGSTAGDLDGTDTANQARTLGNTGFSGGDANTLYVYIAEGVTTANDIQAAVDGNTDVATRRAAELFGFNNSTDSDGTGTVRAQAFAGAVDNGVTGGEIIATGNDIVAAINGNSGAAALVTASLGAGNDGYGVATEFSDYAFTGTDSANNRLQFLSPAGGPDIRFVANANQTLGVDTTTSPRTEGFSKLTFQAAAADASLIFTAQQKGTEFDGYNIKITDAGAVGAGNEVVKLDRENKTLEILIDDTATNASDIIAALANDDYASQFFTASAFDGGAGAARITVADGTSNAASTSDGGLQSAGTLVINLGTNSSGAVTTTANELIAFFDDPGTTITDTTKLAATKKLLSDYGISVSNAEGSDGNGKLAATTSDASFATSGTDFTDAKATGTTFSANGVNAQLDFTSLTAGAEYDNVNVAFVADATVTQGNETANYDASTKTLTFRTADGATTAADIAAIFDSGDANYDADIAALFSASLVGTGAEAVSVFDNAKLTGGVVDAGSTEGAALLGNADAAATGLTFTATNYGSDNFVSIKALSGTFDLQDASGKATDRSAGTDVNVRINGIQAIGDGLSAKINTASLDLKFSVAESAGDDTRYEFSITGGGALFQLGPNVVSNQQANLGIQSVSTARLGGVSGRLFELRSGGTKSLAVDAGGAADVIEETITAVTNLRGRLGAFQKTTLETNIFTLNDTLANLVEAESSIRDADFAAESARLTRAQILVQSGTSVLGIANQNPQNVLSLLR